mmetsp:Transcript_26983/g.65491  ORF Transcript_26983/g.65491 Transcript_26983/m.65491 type:complete len:103 (-) Transcript_26983:202-510(-)
MTRGLMLECRFNAPGLQDMGMKGDSFGSFGINLGDLSRIFSKRTRGSFSKSARLPVIFRTRDVMLLMQQLVGNCWANKHKYTHAIKFQSSTAMHLLLHPLAL